MCVTSLDKDLDGSSMTLIAGFDARVERVWELFADPRMGARPNSAGVRTPAELRIFTDERLHP